LKAQGFLKLAFIEGRPHSLNKPSLKAGALLNVAFIEGSGPHELAPSLKMETHHFWVQNWKLGEGPQKPVSLPRLSIEHAQ
jgi:hypothetical protein